MRRKLIWACAQEATAHERLTKKNSNSSARPRYSRLTVAALGLMTFAGCSDQQALVSPPQTAQESHLDVTAVIPKSPVGFAQPAHTLQDEFAEMSRRIPGGFGGMFFDADGILNIVLTQVDRAAEARLALINEPFIRARMAGVRGERFDPTGADWRMGKYSFSELDHWFHELVAELQVIPRMSGINVSRNSILIGVGSEEERAEVIRTALEIGVPDEALLIDIVPEVHALNLRDRHRPVPGGVQIVFRHRTDGDSECTIGPNLLRLEQRGFLVNSHCTRYPRHVDWSDVTHFWQPTRSGSNHIGNEGIDPPLFACSENPEFGCRNSDAALGLYNGSTSDQLGRIARPAGRNNQTLVIDSNQPRFRITARNDWSIEGEVLEKVGRTTGWSGGEVVQGCMGMAPTDIHGNVVGPTMRCSMIVNTVAGSGDSGSPVFEMSSGTEVVLRGMLWGGRSTEQEACVSLQGHVQCPQFIASNLGGIHADLDPYGDAPLQYFSTGGGGSEPDPCEPEEPEEVTCSP